MGGSARSWRGLSRVDEMRDLSLNRPAISHQATKDEHRVEDVSIICNYLKYRRQVAPDHGKQLEATQEKTLTTPVPTCIALRSA